MRKESFLFLIDGDLEVMTIERSLKKCHIGNPLVRARSGLEVLEMMRDANLKQAYVALLDLRMLLLGGLEFFHEVRADTSLSDSILFTLTTSDNAMDISRCHKTNIAGYFLKELTREKLKEFDEFLKGYWRLAELPSNRLGTSNL